MMFPVVLLLEKKLLPDGGKSSYYQGVNIIFGSVYLLRFYTAFNSQYFDLARFSVLVEII